MPVEVYHIQKGKLVRVPNPGEFGRGDCYLVDAGPKIYLWIGPKSSVDEKFLTAAEAVMRDTARQGHAQIERVEGGHEPQSFKALFPTFKLTDQDTESFLRKVQLEKHEHKLWRLSGDVGDSFYMEVPKKKESLDSEDVFVLDTWNKIYVWRGKKASARERMDATLIARRYDAERAGVQNVILVEEGEEPDEFRRALS
ncbi:MAG: hypothetical protein HXY34_04155 [Candidatus Thorarchaeota archaeon]|nr:hypothetical protein [Candidatus Thorarchaeota archaeon]